MNISRPFIERPVATTLLTIGLALVGMVAFRLLPVSPLPQIDIPTISVTASLPGASPETMAATVATPLERALGSIAGVNEITSSSALGSSRVTLQFNLNRDIDGAARDVQAALNAVRPQLPSGMPSPPTYRKINPADAPIMILALTSPTLSQGQMYDAAATVLAQRLSQIDGVGQASIGGGSLPSVRVELDPRRLDALEISTETVRTAITATNSNRPKGTVSQGERQWQIYANDQAKTAAEYRNLIIAWRNGAAVRLADVAEVVDSVQDLRNAGSANGKPAILININRQPGANIVDTVDRVKALLPQLRAQIPPAISLDVMMDRTPSIRASLAEVERTLMIAVGLVIVVVFAFLRNARATLIPIVAVPVSLTATFAVMYVAGFSLDNLSLMALTVATGFVVDDAIVVLENVTRHLEEGLSPMAAALKGAREVGFTVVSMSISLVAVFIPILFMGGLVGRLFREFAVVLAVAVLVSLLVSLTTTPMMCARLLKSRADEAGAARPPGRLARAAQRLWDGIAWGYDRSLGWTLRHGWLTLLILIAAVGLNVYLYIVIPKGFFPQQDTGRMVGFVRADQGISFQAMREKMNRFIDIVRADPAVENVTGFTGGGQRNVGSMFVSLKPQTERNVSVDQVIARLRAKMLREPGAQLFLQAVQDIRTGGRQSNSQYQFTLQSDDLELLRRWEPLIRIALADLPELADVNTDEQSRGLQTSLTVNRDMVASLGLNMRTVDTVLGNLFGQRQVSTIYNPLNQYRVIMEAAPEFWQSPEVLSEVRVVNNRGDAVPLSAFASFAMTNTSLSVNHQGQFAATTVSFNLPEGVSLSQAIAAIDHAMARIGVPTTIFGRFQGTAQAFQAALTSQLWLILAALLAVYIVLGMLYESLVHPLTILSTLPSAGIGALLALMATGTEFSLIAMIGIILLIGIVKKNAIMMIDFAIAATRERGMPPMAAIREACRLRFRPIMMTTAAAMLGALPLALGRGEGAELRTPLGISIVGGLLVSQLLTLYTTPVVYLHLDRMRLAWAGWRARRRARRAAGRRVAAGAEGAMKGAQ